MNYRQRMKCTKRKNGIKKRRRPRGFLRVMKKVRGKVNRRSRVIKIHSVTDIDFVFSTSFAIYRIPRSCCVTFSKASQHELQNVVCYLTIASCLGFDSDGYLLSFYWYDLDDVFDIDQFRKFEVARTGTPFPKNTIVV